MVATPTPTEVRTIITTSLDDAALTVFIADAAMMVDQCPKVAAYPDAQQKAIVRWVTAHLIAVTAQGGVAGQLTSKSLGDASESYASGAVGSDLKSSPYGQQAIALDPSGCL